MVEAKLRASGGEYGSHETCDDGSANLAAIESEARELIQSEAPSKSSAETDSEIAPLIEKIGRFVDRRD
jgi:hypothetical protein